MGNMDGDGQIYDTILEFNHVDFGRIVCACFRYEKRQAPRLTVTNEPRCEKTGLRGFRPGQTQTGLYGHSRWLES